MKNIFKQVATSVKNTIKSFDKAFSIAVIAVVCFFVWLCVYLVTSPFRELREHEVTVADSLAREMAIQAAKDSARADSINAVAASRTFVLDSLEKIKEIEAGRSYYKVDKHYYNVNIAASDSSVVVDSLKVSNDE